MPTITKKELEDYKKISYDREHERLLTVDGLRLICDGLSRDPEAIGKHFLEILARIQSTDKPISSRNLQALL